jgi:hypothetical protein
MSRIILGFILSTLAFRAYAVPPLDPEQPINAAPSLPATFVSTGERITLEDKGFSIVPPLGWNVETNIPHLTLRFQVPNSPDLEYQRTIQVAWGATPYVIDEFTANEFAKTLVERRSKIYSSISGYRLRNKLPVTLQNGTPGLLFYTEFEFDGLPMMELHILVSSASGHFLMTYTDLAKYFETEGESGPLAEAFDSLMTAEIASPNSGRFDFLIKAGIGFLAFLVFWGIVRFFQGRHRFSADVDDAGDDSGWGESGRMTTTHSSVHTASQAVRTRKKAAGSNYSTVDNDGHTFVDDDDEFSNVG